MESHLDTIANLYITTKNNMDSDDIYDIACEMSKSLPQTVGDTISDLHRLYCNGFKL